MNPISGVKRKAKLPDQIQQYLDHDKFDYRIEISAYAGHATVLAQKAVDEHVDVVISVGGDGSVNEIGRVLMHTDVTLGIIPLGSGNGLARNLNIPRKIKKALQVINNLKTIKMDVGTFGDNYFFSNIGWGFVAEVVNSYAQMKSRGFLSYAYAVAKQSMFVYRSQTMRFSLGTEGEEREEDLFMLNVFNANEFGYGVTTAPEATVTDGELNVSVVKRFPKWKLPIYAIKLLTGNPFAMQALTEYKVNELTLIHDGEAPIASQVDGEPWPLKETVKIGLNPAALNIIVP